MRDRLLRALHLGGGREAVTQAIDALCDSAAGASWAEDRARASDRRDLVDDAIAWLAWRIAGPGLLGDTGHETHPDLLTARANVVLARIPDEPLTRAEYVAWAWSSVACPADWLSDHLGVPRGARHVAVARWVAARLRHHDQAAALHRESTIAGDHVGGLLIDRLDELELNDLCGSVRDTFVRARERAILARWSGPPELAPEEPWEATLPDGVRRLRFARELLDEGHDMAHCVAQYCDAVHRRACDILSVVAEDGTRATCEVVREGSGWRARQLVGPRNSPPSDACRALVARWVTWS